MLLVYVTCKNKQEAHRLARVLVKEGLAACANYYETTSVYKWKGKIVKEKETVLHLKTLEKHYDKLERRIKKLHSYELPCIIAFPITRMEYKYAKWVERNCKRF